MNLLHVDKRFYIFFSEMAVNLNALNISLIEDVRIQAFFTTKLP